MTRGGGFVVSTTEGGGGETVVGRRGLAVVAPVVVDGGNVPDVTEVDGGAVVAVVGVVAGDAVVGVVAGDAVVGVVAGDAVVGMVGDAVVGMVGDAVVSVVGVIGGHGAGHCVGQGCGTGHCGGITHGTHGGCIRGVTLLVAIVPLFPLMHCGHDPGFGTWMPEKIRKRSVAPKSYI